MATYFVTRHPGAVAWADRRGLKAVKIEHLEPSDVAAGDIVMGTLPVHIVADIQCRGSRYLHLEMDVPPAWRGRDLSADDMDRFGARLVEYRVDRVQVLTRSRRR